MRIFRATRQEMIREINPFNAKNLTFEGGGAAGLGYVGSVQALEELDILKQVERVGGTSAGAITAFLISIGCTSQEIKTYLSAQSLKDMVYKRWYNPFTWNLFREYGVYEKDKIVTWLENITVEKLGPEYRRLTFAQLRALREKTQQKDPSNNTHKDLTICVTNLTTQHLDLFSADSDVYKDTPIVDAVALGSVSIPFYFKAWRYLTHWFVDGGVIANDPQIIYDTPADQTEHGDFEFNEETLAFRLDTQAEVSNMFDGKDRSQTKKTVGSGGFFTTKIDGLVSFIQALVNALQQAQSFNFLRSYMPYRTVIIPRQVTIEGNKKEIGATDFDMTDDAKDQLMKNGYEATMAHFNEARLALAAAELTDNVLDPQANAHDLTLLASKRARLHKASLSESLLAVNEDELVMDDVRPRTASPTKGPINDVAKLTLSSFC